MTNPGAGPMNEPNELLGVSLMMVAASIGAVDAVIIRHLSPEVHPLIMGFTRALFGLVVVLPWLLSRPKILKTKHHILHFLRAGLKLASLLAYFVAFATAPLALVTAIAFTTPIFATVGAWLFLAERPRALRIAAVAVGFVGVLIILAPGQSEGLSTGLMWAFLGAVFAALIQVMLKPMSARDTTETLVAWNLIWTVPIAAVPAFFVWMNPTPAEWALLAVQGVLGAVAMACVTRAFRYAEVSLLGPVDFLRLPFVAVLGYLFFGQVVAISTWLGALVIFGATLLMARSARRRVPPI